MDGKSAQADDPTLRPKKKRMISKSQIKYIQSLNQKKLRQENGVFVAEGPKIINELLAASNTEPVAIYATAEWWQQNDDIKNEIPFVSFYEISNAELERISFLSTPHQVLGIFREPKFSHAPDPGSSLVLLLDNIQDPGNIGTIIRIADWFAIKHIVAGRESADIFNPKVVQATMGSVARVQLLYQDLHAFIDSHQGAALYSTTLDGKPVHECGKVNKGMLLVGNESKGIRQELLAISTHKITIPRYGEAESLNAAVATGIILSHLIANH
jgi:TrmH family RNA methyltransferase